MKVGITERGDGAIGYANSIAAMKRLDVDAAILITKAPQILLTKTLPTNVLVHCTITGIGGTYFEPGVSPTSVTIPAYHALVEKYGGERIILRIDPIIPYDWMLLEALKVAVLAKGRVRVSFMDFYAHALERMGNIDWTNLPEFKQWRIQGEFHAPLKIRTRCLNHINRLIAPHGEAEVCAEPGIICSGCISIRDLDAVGIHVPSSSLTHGGTQRKLCCCAAEKIELLNMGNVRQCHKIHKCKYCYWRD